MPLTWWRRGGAGAVPVVVGPLPAGERRDDAVGARVQLGEAAEGRTGVEVAGVDVVGVELARERGVKLPSESEEGLRELVFKDSYRDLPDYLHGFAYTCAVLSDEEALERVAYELGCDCLAEGVRYLEVRFAPHLQVRPGLVISSRSGGREGASASSISGLRLASRSDT